MLSVISLVFLSTLAADPGSLAHDSFAPTSLSSSVFGKFYTTNIPTDPAVHMPRWKESDENPPLSARDAMRLANEKAKKIQATVVTPGSEGEWRWQTNGIRLCELGAGEWYWLCSYTALPTKMATSGPAGGFYVAVLMDGTVISPEVSVGLPKE